MNGCVLVYVALAKEHHFIHIKSKIHMVSLQWTEAGVQFKCVYS